MEKKIEYVGFKASQQEKAAVIAAARAAGLPLSEYIRRRLHPGASSQAASRRRTAPTTSPAVAQHPVFNVKDIGEDALFSGRQALAR